ncbi:hypothetical protein B6U98_00625 [Thermoplasmatales archaeon ex4572_165]|nr:MAG: hypothetical protein B6U98_00625 [Thermoplasmatales archaeon ex4572_165]
MVISCLLIIIVLVPSIMGIPITYFDSECDRFDFIEVNPTVQMPGKSCIFTSIIYPVMDIQSVRIVITVPNGSVIEAPMDYCLDGKYVFQVNFQDLGKYYFFINLDTKKEGLFQSSLYSFWISSSYLDKDSDMLPDEWEEKFGFNIENSDDAYIDSDNDGYTNLEEYRMNTNPLKNNIIENGWYKLSEKQMYLSISFLLFCILFLFSWYGVRRETT